MNILVTGANGQLGKCIRDQVKLLDKTDNTYIYSDVVGSDDADTEYLDIVDEEEVKKFVKKNSINIIINCAAYTNVDKAESDYETAEAINAIAPRNLAEAALSVGAKLIHISTDYVFNGMGFTPYTEERTTLPVSVYGKTKQEVADKIHTILYQKQQGIYVMPQKVLALQLRYVLRPLKSHTHNKPNHYYKGCKTERFCSFFVV